MKQAHYSETNLGHAGLGSPAYAHFTSPIRRYPDLVAHRALLALVGAEEDPPRAERMAEAAVQCSERERDASQAERAGDDVCAAFLLRSELFERGPETRFDGEVSGLVGGGAFVRFGGALADVYEGFLPARLIGGRERYELDPTETMLVGAREGAAIRMGDPVRVSVDSIEAPRGRVDLVPVAAPGEGHGARRQGQGEGRLRQAREKGRAAPQRRAAQGARAMSKKAKKKAEGGDVATNRRARHKFQLLEKMEAGVELRGSEVKSLRDGKASINEAYAVIEKGEMWLRGAHIPPYLPASTENHDPERAAQAAAAPPRDRAADRQDGREGADAGADADLLQGPARQGRDRARQGQGGPRPPPRDPGPRPAPRGRAGLQAAPLLTAWPGVRQETAQIRLRQRESDRARRRSGAWEHWE